MAKRKYDYVKAVDDIDTSGIEKRLAAYRRILRRLVREALNRAHRAPVVGIDGVTAANRIAKELVP